MAVWNEIRSNIRYRIHDVDHAPPHCHVIFKGRRMKISLETLEFFPPSGATVPPAVRKYLKKNQQAMLEAWQEVVISDPL